MAWCRRAAAVATGVIPGKVRRTRASGDRGNRSSGRHHSVRHLNGWLDHARPCNYRRTLSRPLLLRRLRWPKGLVGGAVGQPQPSRSLPGSINDPERRQWASTRWWGGSRNNGGGRHWRGSSGRISDREGVTAVVARREACGETVAPSRSMSGVTGGPGGRGKHRDETGSRVGWPNWQRQPRGLPIPIML